MYDIVYKGRFVWNRLKAEKNLRDHKISFEKATEAFDDALAVVEYDEENSLDEDRFNLIGYVDGFSLVMVTFTDRGDLKRIISARKAEGDEKHGYKDNARHHIGVG